MDGNEWYVGQMDRKEAEKKLLHPVNDHGAFLIRNSESLPQHFSLSLRDGDRVKHYLIRSTEDGIYFIKGRTFNCMQDLVYYFTTVFDNGLDGVQLKRPCHSVDGFGNNDSFFPNITDSYETDRSSVKFIRKLGAGRFGEVCEGVWKKSTRVAIKSLLYETTDSQQLLDEAQILKNLTHPNIIKLLAVCTLEEPIYLISELMDNNLLSYLRDVKQKGCILTMPDLIKIASGICCGMAYLENEHYIHRDLKARKVLMGGDNIVKIASFSSAKFAKNGWYQDQNLTTKILSKWAAPEVISGNSYSIKSDVWSFGILLTELVTHGEVPYGEEMSEEITMFKVLQGYRMPCLFGCPTPLYDIMKECWQEESTDRPSFAELQFKLEDFFTLDPFDYKNA